MLKYRFIVLLGLVFAFTACDNDKLLDLNVDPNNPTSIPAVNLVSQAEFAINNLLWSRGYNAEWTMLLVQHWAQNEYAEESRYTVDGNSFNFAWEDFYAEVLNELRTARNLIEKDENVVGGRRANQLAIIDILRAHTYHNLTDAFGAVPYSQALNSVEFPNPSYDSQESIYRDLLTSLDAAVNSIDTSAGSFDAGELIYGGNAAMWKKLGNSLMLRIAMRMVDVDASTAGQYINAAAGDLISSNAENALFVFSDNPDLANPLFVDAVINTRDDFAVSDVVVDNLKDMGDPRLEMFAGRTNTDEIIGMPYGLTDGEAFALKSTTSRPNDMVRAATAPAVIMDYAEVQFLLAEAYERGILSGDAAAAYAAGVTASMNYWGITDDAAIADYIAANGYDSANWKQSLGWQKWIAFYMNGPQAWAEWRRLDHPVLAVPAAATEASIPVRLPYPVDEQTRNTAALQAVTSTPNDLATKMWWDVN